MEPKSPISISNFRHKSFNIRMVNNGFILEYYSDMSATLIFSTFDEVSEFIKANL